MNEMLLFNEFHIGFAPTLFSRRLLVECFVFFIIKSIIFVFVAYGQMSIWPVC